MSIYDLRQTEVEEKGNMAGLGNTRGIVLQYNSGLTELQGIGQNISPGEFYWRELIKSTTDRERIDEPLNFQQ